MWGIIQKMAVEDSVLCLPGIWHWQMMLRGRGNWSEEKWIWQLLKHMLFVCTSVALAAFSFSLWCSPLIYFLYFISHAACRCLAKWRNTLEKTLWATIAWWCRILKSSLHPLGLMRMLSACIRMLLLYGIDQSSMHVCVVCLGSVHGGVIPPFPLSSSVCTMPLSLHATPL